MRNVTRALVGAIVASLVAAAVSVYAETPTAGLGPAALHDVPLPLAGLLSRAQHPSGRRDRRKSPVTFSARAEVE